jgi:hypothetical protein
MSKKSTTKAVVQKETGLAKASYSVWDTPGSTHGSVPWAPSDIDKFELKQDKWEFIVNDCRYYYKRDPIASIVVNKIVDLAINDIHLRVKTGRKVFENIFESIKPNLLQFLRSCGLEFLISGLVVPEIEFTKVGKDDLDILGIKRFSSLLLPTEMWLRDPSLITINDPLIGGKVSYFTKIPDKLRYFINNNGVYEDNTEDKQLYTKLVQELPEFVAQVKEGKETILLDNPLIIRHNVITGSPYPVPYLYPALESLKHKRNLRRMDYSVASRVITAIQKFTMGDKDFPLTEDNEDQLQELKTQMMWRESTDSRNAERIFQLFGNHTLQIEWIVPPVEALLDDTKYKNVNGDIAMALGFPRILVTGETERSFTSDPEIATLSPAQTMKRMQEVFLPIVRRIIDIIIVDNNLGATDISVRFQPINMIGVTAFMQGLQSLYDTGNLSREDYAAAFGFDVYDQLEKRSDEKDILKDYDLEEFAPVPHSNVPNVPGKTTQKPTKPVVKPTGKSKAGGNEDAEGI